jgi:hypothetical protein
VGGGGWKLKPNIQKDANKWKKDWGWLKDEEWTEIIGIWEWDCGWLRRFIDETVSKREQRALTKSKTFLA